MDAEFWLKRWREGATGFHMTRVTPLLTKHWPAFGLPSSTRVLVPLCGKSLDMVWLAAQGHRVLGVELAPMAVEQFFSEQGLRPSEHVSSMGRHYVAGNIEIICGDIFDVDAQTLSTCGAAFDRGALVALPKELRLRYATHVYGNLARDYRGMLLTLEYEQSRMQGPPFSIPEVEVRSLFRNHTEPTIIDQMDILAKEPKFKDRGLDRLLSVAWRLQGSR